MNDENHYCVVGIAQVERITCSQCPLRTRNISHKPSVCLLVWFVIIARKHVEESRTPAAHQQMNENDADCQSVNERDELPTPIRIWSQ